MRNGPVPPLGASRQPFPKPGQFVIHLRACADLIQLCLELLIAQREAAPRGTRRQQVTEPGCPRLLVGLLIFGTAGGYVGV